MSCLVFIVSWFNLNGTLRLEPRGAWKTVATSALLAPPPPHPMRGAGGECPELTAVYNKAVSSVPCSNADVKRIAREELLDALIEHILKYPEEVVLY